MCNLLHLERCGAFTVYNLFRKIALVSIIGWCPGLRRKLLICALSFFYGKFELFVYGREKQSTEVFGVYGGNGATGCCCIGGRC